MNNQNPKKEIFITESVKEWETDEFNVGLLKEVLQDLPNDLDIRISHFTGEELLGRIDLNLSKEESADCGYKYLLLQALDIDCMNESAADGWKALEKVHGALQKYNEALKNRENGNVAAGRFVEAVEGILADVWIDEEYKEVAIRKYEFQQQTC